MRMIPDEPRADRIPLARVGDLLARWQDERDPEDFCALVRLVREPLARIAARTLRRGGIRDPGACDDAVGLVLERLFRLSEPGGTRSPPPFRRPLVGSDAAGDPGWAYLRCVTRSRACDVARAIRRRDRLAADFATLALRFADAEDFTGAARDAERLRSAVATLDARSREVVGLLLDGKSQAIIAHVLGVCEGTVSRIRKQAIATLREVLARHEKLGGG